MIIIWLRLVVYFFVWVFTCLFVYLVVLFGSSAVSIFQCKHHTYSMTTRSCRKAMFKTNKTDKMVTALIDDKFVLIRLFLCGC